MSYLVVVPDALASAATDLASIASTSSRGKYCRRGSHDSDTVCRR